MSYPYTGWRTAVRGADWFPVLASTAAGGAAALGDEQAKELASIGVNEDIHNIASHRPFGRSVFYQWLGPESWAAWDELCESWRQVTAAKAAGLLEPARGRPSAPPADPVQIQDPALRRVVEQLYR